MPETKKKLWNTCPGFKKYS